MGLADNAAREDILKQHAAISDIIHRFLVCASLMSEVLVGGAEFVHRSSQTTGPALEMSLS